MMYEMEVITKVLLWLSAQGNLNASISNLISINSNSGRSYLGRGVSCVVCIIKANIDCKDGEACNMYTDDNLNFEEADNRMR